MSRQRGFEVVSKFEHEDIHLPSRSTKGSAGYDFEASSDVTIPVGFKAVLVPTGIKAYMMDDEYLQVANRSSNPLKKGLIMANGIGIIDQDYYNNPDNEGHIMFQFMNITDQPIDIRKGDKIGQGIFLKYGCIDGEREITASRSGGFGSTGD